MEDRKAGHVIVGGERLKAVVSSRLVFVGDVVLLPLWLCCSTALLSFIVSPYHLLTMVAKCGKLLNSVVL